MKTRTKVKLKSFNGTLEPVGNCLSHENYWKLIGYSGKIVQDPKTKGLYSSFSEKPRLLIQFDKDLGSLGLECHNNVKNSLWILESDLDEI